MTAALLDRLRGIVGDTHVLTAPDLVAGYLRDWTGRFAADSGVVVRPADTAQVSAVLAACAEAGAAVLPQGGNTGLVGASVPLHGEIVLHTGRLRGLEVDEVAGQLLAGAGETIGAVHAAAASVGLAYGVDLASRDSCTVGGTVATNAGGLRVLRHGDTRRQVIGVEAVLSDGAVLSHLGGLTRDNTGYHLPSLLAGSEGTLAVLTRVRLRLVPAPGPSAVAVLGLAAPADAVVAAGFARRIAGVSAVEFFLPAGLGLVREVTGLGAVLPADHGAYLLLEVDWSAEALVQACEDLPGVQDAAIAEDAAGRAALWAYRERHTESIAARGPVIKLDVTLPMSTAAAYLDRLPSVVADLVPDAQVWLFGHLADGNVHTNITGVPDADTHRLEDTVLRMVADLGGSIASEHGIGIAKREWLGLGRSDAEIDAFRRIKRALDPAGILHPHAVLGP